MGMDGRYLEVYDPYPNLTNIDGANIYTKAHVTNASDQVGFTSDKRSSKYDELNTMPCLSRVQSLLAAKLIQRQTWTDMGFDRSVLIPTKIRMAAANQGANYVAGRTSIMSLQLGGRHLWMSFLVVEKLDEPDQFILRRHLAQNFDVTIELSDGLIRIMYPERKYEKNSINKILINQAKVPIFLNRKID